MESTSLTEQVNALPLLCDADDAAALCAVSRSHWMNLHTQGKVPLPVRLGRAVRWSRAELDAWIAAGCPARAKWQTMRDRAMNRRAS